VTSSKRLADPDETAGAHISVMEMWASPTLFTGQQPQEDTE
jgi:hypothetical protein